MAYTPTEWENGDIITAAKLNKAEQGIADASSIVTFIGETVESDVFTLEKTWKELKDMQDAGRLLVVNHSAGEGYPAETSIINPVYYQEGLGYVAVVGFNNYVAATQDDYPQYNAG